MRAEQICLGLTLGLEAVLQTGEAEVQLVEGEGRSCCAEEERYLAVFPSIAIFVKLIELR